MFTVQGVNASGVTFLTVEVDTFKQAHGMAEQMKRNPACVRVDIDQRVLSEHRRRSGGWDLGAL